MSGISKAFSGVPALIDVDLDLQRGKVHALLGQNGAGKSTLISIMSGVLQPDSGTIEIDGLPVEFPSPSAALEGGVVAVYQELSLLPNMTVAQNLALGIEPTRAGFIDLRSMEQEARRVLDVLGATDIDPRTAVGDLSIANQQLVEIAKALVREARIVILDEPSAVLGDDELSLLYAMVRRLTSSGIAVVYITHRLDEVMEIADEVCVMRDGRKVVDEPRGDLTQADMIKAPRRSDLDGEWRHLARHGQPHFGLLRSFWRDPRYRGTDRIRAFSDPADVGRPSTSLRRVGTPRRTAHKGT
jgi:ABC-type sugar transport system ATPase subunit